MNIGYLSNGIQNNPSTVPDEIRKNSPSLENIGKLINQGWEIKKNLSPLILTDEISELFEEISVCDLYGSKLLGAGAGGFILSIHKDLRKDLKTISKKWAAFSPKLDHSGARILSSN